MQEEQSILFQNLFFRSRFFNFALVFFLNLVSNFVEDFMKCNHI